jgi:hypothetical protein
MQDFARLRVHGRWLAVTAALVTMIATAPAHACRIYRPIRLEDVRSADVVLVGRISNYRIIRDHDFRRKMLANPNLPANDRKLYENPRTFLLTDYARFDVTADEMLVGTAPKTLSLSWRNSTFAEPETMAAGPYLIALRRRSAAIPADPGEPPLTILQAGCSSPFMFETHSDQARAVRRILSAGPR